MSPLLISVSVFVAVVLVSIAVFMFVTTTAEEEGRLKRRLEGIAEESSTGLSGSLEEEEGRIDSFLAKLPGGEGLHRLLEQADFKMRLGQFVFLVLMLALTGLIGGFLLAQALGRVSVPQLWMTGGGLGFLLAAIPFGIVWDRKRLRIRKFTEQFPDALSMISRSVRAGHGFNVAMQLVGNEMPEPICQFFKRASEEQKFGLNLEEVLENLTRRMPTLDVQFFASAVDIQRETGGNLAEVMDKLASVIRERFRIMGEIRVYTAQGRLSGLVLAALPLFMAVALFIMQPKYIKVLFTDRVGLMMVGVAVALQIIGYFVIRRIINIKI
jgi:tight adherence protein B